METLHESVLLREVVEMLAPRKIPGQNSDARRCLLDGTLGGGGHAEALLQNDPNAILFGFDRDPQALERVRRRLAANLSRIKLFEGNFAEFADRLPDQLFDGMLFDLGLSSDQLDDSSRGFSFRFDGPLDMRMQREGETAAEILNSRSEAQLDRLFRVGGVSPQESRRLAREVFHSRPIETTFQFAEVCRRANPVWKRQKRGESIKDPAIVPFQALRIEVNQEFAAIERMLPLALRHLAPGGRLAVISFHSLEDQLVAGAMRSWVQQGKLPPGVPVRGEETGAGRLLNRQAIVPSEEEIAKNPRARSARLRVFEKSGIQ